MTDDASGGLFNNWLPAYRILQRYHLIADNLCPTNRLDNHADHERSLNLANEVNGGGRDELKVGRREVELAFYRPRHRPIFVA